ncbi:hypothetical protein ACFLRA_02095 [Bdellovibrionota bacterium]
MLEGKKIFKVGAIWNFFLVIPFFFLKHLITRWLQLSPVEYPVFIDLMLMNGFLIALLCVWISRSKGKEIIAMRFTVWAKFGFVLVFLYHITINSMPHSLTLLLVPVVVIDLGFAVGFQRQLWKALSS